MTDSLLVRAARTLPLAHDEVRALTDLCALLVPELADWALADLLQPPDLVTRVAAVGPSGPVDLPPELGPVDSRRSSARAAGLLTRLVDAPGRRLVLAAADLAALADTPDLRLQAQVRLALSFGATEVVVLGIGSRDELLGVVSLGRSRAPVTPPELAVLDDLARLAGLVLDALRLRVLQRGVSTALQQSLLPMLPVVRGVSVAARFVPAGSGLAVGGDWYDVFVLPHGPVALVVGDATGHDVQAATRMAELRNLLRGVAVDEPQPPAATFARLDRVLAHLSPELSGTCVYGQVEVSPEGGRLLWSSAGHLPPVLLRAGTATLLETPADLMLGVRAGIPRADHTRGLQVGDVLVLYTDGLVEQRRTGLDDRLAVLARQVEQVGAHSLEGLVDALVEQLPSGDDDAAVLALRVEPWPDASAPHLQEDA